MSEKRQVEIYSAGCPVCQDTINLVNRIACDSCEIRILDMNNTEIAARAIKLGIRSVPAVTINGKLAECCSDRGVDENTLRAAGIGQPLT